jgi:sugar porter (SP) family MFS transporter
MSQINVHYNKTYVWMVALVAALGGLLFGYDWVVIGGAKPFYEAFFNLSDPAAQGWAMSSALVGCLVGALVAGPASDRWGRKRPLIAAAFLFTISAVGTGLANNIDVFNIYRIIGGLGIGLASGLSPVYIAEISPAALRGRLVSVNQFTIVIGILAAQIVNLLIADPVAPGTSSQDILQSWNGQTGWRWMFWAEAFPAGLFIILSFFIPESPRWLAKQRRNSESLSIFNKIYGGNAGESVLREVQTTVHDGEEKVNWSELKEPKILSALTVGIVLAVFQQWCGINVIFNYAADIFANAGYSVSDTLFNIVITGTVNVAATIAALFLVDKVGRRGLMLWGSASLAVIYAVMGACYHFQVTGPAVLALVLIAIACYGVSLAPVVWVIISEIFPNRVRGISMSLAVGSLWIACFLLTYTFPMMNKALGASGTFWIYGIICAAGYVFTLKKLPETKGKTLEEIEQAF